MRIFIASPLGFSECGRLLLPVLRARLRELGYEPVNPWDASGDLEDRLRRVNLIAERESRQNELRAVSMAIAERNASLLRGCEGVLAVLDGCDVDSGTASEIGYAFGLGGRTINGYRGDFRRSGENDGVSINLQVEYWIRASGGTIVNSVDELDRLAY